jgi:GNAT superfamily N-acetyltransferase
MGERSEIRPLARRELDTMLDWASDEGWNPGLHDADAFFAADPDGFLGLDVDGQLTVTASIVRYDRSFAFAGCYICHPDHRGHGFGLHLAETALARCDATTIGLDGVLEQEENYTHLGFFTAHHSIRFGGTPAQRPATGDLRVLDTSDIDRVLAFERDHEVFPAQRRAFLERWLSAPGSTALAVSDGDRIDGYGVIRVCHEGHKIGPLFCSARATAERLLAALVARADHGPVFLDVPVPNEDGITMARDLGLEPVFETARMYRGPDPALRLDRVFGITTFELG